MRLLLDTHSFLWFIGGDKSLSAYARSLIEDDDNEVFLSVASLWEIAIKVSLGKLRLEQPFDLLIPQQLYVNNIELCAITVQHASVVATLPFHHRDPFDRLLIAQALVEQLLIIGHDQIFDAYAVQRIW